MGWECDSVGELLICKREDLGPILSGHVKVLSVGPHTCNPRPAEAEIEQFLELV